MTYLDFEWSGYYHFFGVVSLVVLFLSDLN